MAESKARLISGNFTTTGAAASIAAGLGGGLDSAQVLAIAGADSASISTILSTSTMI